MRLLLLDEAQMAYQGHDDLWSGELKLTQQTWMRRSIRILAAAAYGLTASGQLEHASSAPMPRMELSSTALSALSLSEAAQQVTQAAATVQAAAANAAARPGQRCTAGGLPATPLTLHPTQVVTVRPVQLPVSNADDDSERLSLCFDWNDMLEVYTAWSTLVGIQLGEYLQQYIYLLAGGQVSRFTARW